MSHTQLAMDSVIFAAALIVLRLVWVYPGAHVAYAIRTRLLKQEYPRPGARALFVVGWTGMRGVVALAAALSLPMVLQNGQPLPERSVIIFLTYVVIVVTLVGQGFSLPPLVRALGLKPSSAERCEENEAREMVLQSAIDYLDQEKVTRSEQEAHAISDVLHFYRHRVEELRTSREKLTHEEEAAEEAPFLYQLRCDLLANQRNRLMELRSEARIGDGVFRTIERELDLEAARLGTQA